MPSASGAAVGLDALIRRTPFASFQEIGAVDDPHMCIEFRLIYLEVPEQPTKLLPLAPVCVIVPACLHDEVMITRSGPGEPTTNQYQRVPDIRLTPFIFGISKKKNLTAAVNLPRRQDREFLVRSRYAAKREALVVVVLVRVRRAAGRATGLEEGTSGLRGPVDGIGAVLFAPAGSSRALEEVGRSGAGDGYEGEEADCELHIGESKPWPSGYVQRFSGRKTRKQCKE